MELVKLGGAVLNQIPLAWEHNRDNMLAAISAARAEGVSLLCLPELCVTGYGCEDAFHSPGVIESAWRLLADEIRPATRGMVVSVGLPVSHNKALFNCNCLLADGRILGFVAKHFLAGDGIHYEPRWFKPWPVGPQTVLLRDGQRYPIGDIHFDIGGIKIGYEICEDAWVASRPGADLAMKGVDIILNPSASHFAFNKLEVRKRLVLEGARAFGVSYLYVNLLGNEAGRIIYDGGVLIASGGALCAVGPRFSFADHRLTTATVDVDITRMAQARTGSFTPRVDAEPDDCVRVEHAWPALDPVETEVAQEAWESSPHLKAEEFARAEALALFDYMRKSRSHGFVVSLSGGADSAVVSCLVRIMADLALAELGPEKVAQKLDYIRGIGDAVRSPEALVRRLLLCAYQATENSGPVTKNAARAVAEGVGAEYYELNVDSLYKGYRGMIEGAIGRPLAWETDDIALQNIQARVRSPGIWMLANLRGALLLSTSNRSEAAVGYATMDGDTSGGLSPIAGIDKAYLRRWLRWLESEGPMGVGPIPAVAAVNRQQPTAELRPQAQEQTDEKDLMPYELLDFIERCAIRDRQVPMEVFRMVRARFPQYELSQLVLWIERFFRLWCRNQWKRERYAPSFHLDDENLDPKTWCRFPILSGGFERELAELRAHVAELIADKSPKLAAGQ